MRENASGNMFVLQWLLNICIACKEIIDYVLSLPVYNSSLIWNYPKITNPLPKMFRTVQLFGLHHGSNNCFCLAKKGQCKSTIKGQMSQGTIQLLYKLQIHAEELQTFLKNLLCCSVKLIVLCMTIHF